MGGPRVDPEDAAHDVFILVLTRLDRLIDPNRFEAWLFGITRRVLAAHRRKAWWRRWVPGALPDGADHAPSPADQAECSETSRRVQSALEQLPAKQREVLILCDLEERTIADVASILGVPVGTVKSRLRLGRDRLRRSLRRLGLQQELRVIEGGRR